MLARLRKLTFFSLFELNLAIRRLLDELNLRSFKKLPGCRRSQFETLDQPALRPLPAQAYEYQDWRRRRMVSIDYHVEVEKHFYSVPHALCRRKVDARLTEKMVEFFHAGKRVAAHVRSRRQGAYSTNAEHMPKSHRAHLEWTPGRFLNWGVQVGPHTRDLVKHLLENRPHPEMGYRSCLGLLNLAKRFGSTRLEAACQRAWCSARRPAAVWSRCSSRDWTNSRCRRRQRHNLHCCTRTSAAQVTTSERPTCRKPASARLAVEMWKSLANNARLSHSSTAATAGLNIETGNKQNQRRRRPACCLIKLSTNSIA